MTFDLPGEPEAGSTLPSRGIMGILRGRGDSRAAPRADGGVSYRLVFANSTTALSMSPTDMMPTSLPLASTTQRP